MDSAEADVPQVIELTVHEIPSGSTIRELDNVIILPSESLSDEKEETIISELFGFDLQSKNDQLKDCCKLKCCQVIPKDLATRQRRMFRQLTKYEQELIILGQLQAFRQISELEGKYGQYTRRGKSRTKVPNHLSRKNTFFSFATLRICKKMYLFLHDLKEDRFENITKHFDVGGIIPRQRKFKSKSLKKDVEATTADIETVVNFITSKAAQSGMRSPNGTPDLQDRNVIKLPAKETESSIYRQYQLSLKSSPDTNAVARNTFTTIWKRFCPNIIISKPLSDLCEVTGTKKRRK